MRQTDIRQLKAIFIVIAILLSSGIYAFTQNMNALRETIKQASLCISDKDNVGCINEKTFIIKMP